MSEKCIQFFYILDLLPLIMENLTVIRVNVYRSFKNFFINYQIY